MGYLPLEKMKEPLIYKGSWSGRNRTRTYNPSVNSQMIISILEYIIPYSLFQIR